MRNHLAAILGTLAAWIAIAIMWAVVFGVPMLVGALEESWNR